MPQLQRHKRAIPDAGEPRKGNDCPIAALYDGGHRTALKHAFNLFRRWHRPGLGRLCNARILLRKPEIVGVGVPYPTAVTGLFRQPKEERAQCIQDLERGGLAYRLAGSLVPGIVQSAAERNGLLKMKFLEGSKGGGFLKAVDGRGSNINTRIIEPAGGLQVEPVGALNPLVFLVVFHCPVSNGAE